MAQGFTILAVATAPAAGGIGILRISGPHALRVARGVAPGLGTAPVPRKLLRSSFTSRSGTVLDEGLAVYFPGPRSFTGEDVVELHAHGSPALLRLLERELLRDADVRLAEPGEFTRRALVNGRLDLTRAEGILAMVTAPGEAAVRAAAQLLQGRLAERLERVRGPWVALRADLEGALDFPDEAEGALEALPARIDALRAELRALVSEVAAGRLLGREARVVLFGPVNAGKSSLFNQLLAEERALVDAEPGTTRDVLEARLELDGLAVLLLDVAGLRAGAERLEARGIERARAAVRSADLAVLLIPPGATAEDVAAWRGEAVGVAVLEVESKGDLRVGAPGAGRLRVSAEDGSGVSALRTQVLERLRTLGAAEGRVSATERQADALRRALEFLERAAQAVPVAPLEVVAGELALGLEVFAEVGGENVSEAVLDAVFRRFCIGK